MKNKHIIIVGIAAVGIGLFAIRSCSSSAQTGRIGDRSKVIRQDSVDGLASDKRDIMEELEDYAKKGNVNIEFHGRVVDQDGVALPGAEVGYRVHVPSVKSMLTWSSNTKLGKVYTKADGSFEILGIKGSGMSVGPFMKQGYRDSQKAPKGFSYIGSPELHNPSNVVEFLMVSDGAPRTKNIYDDRLSFAWNKGEVKVPLGSGLGYLILIPSRNMPPGLELGQRKGFDWNVKVSMERAELIELKDQSILAPTTGYQKQYGYGYVKDDPKWGGMSNKRYAFRSVDGRYGVLEFKIYIDRADFGVNGILNVRLNESGARNID